MLDCLNQGTAENICLFQSIGTLQKKAYMNTVRDIIK